MELHELKQLAHRLRDVLAQAAVPVSHGQALDLVASVAGLRNWPEVAAFPKRVAAAAVTDDSIERLRLRIEKTHSVPLEQVSLVNALLSNVSDAEPENTNATRPVVLPSDLHTSSIPALFSRFKETVGESHWLKRVTNIEGEIRGAPFLRELLQEQNDIAFALARCSGLVERHGHFPVKAINDRSLYSAFRFVAQTLSLMKPKTVEADQLRRRIHGAFKNPYDMRAIQFELAIATHFIKRRCSLVWPEISGAETFDWFAPNLGDNGLEIECKSASDDKGRKIHRREALECFNAIREQIEQAARNLHSGLSVVLTVPERLPKGEGARRELYTAVARAILEGRSTLLSDGTDIRITDFDVTRYPNLGPKVTAEVRADFDKITGTRNRETMILGRRNGGALVVALQGANEDSFLQSIFSTIDDAARRQLTKKRPGIVLVGLDGMTPSQLVETASQDRDLSQPPTALRIAVSDFLRDTRKSHLVGVGFVSRADFSDDVDGNVSSGGTAYYFPRKESPFWHPDFSVFFAGID